MTLAVARQRKDRIYWYATGTCGVPFFVPLTLAKWERRAGFFILHFGGSSRPDTPLIDPQAAAVEAAHREIMRMRHLILCEGAKVDYVNMEHPLPHQRHPTPDQVEEARRAEACLRQRHRRTHVACMPHKPAEWPGTGRDSEGRGGTPTLNRSGRLQGKGEILLGVSYRPAWVRFPPPPLERNPPTSCRVRRHDVYYLLPAHPIRALFLTIAGTGCFLLAILLVNLISCRARVE